jgi:hypothetical protein
MMKNPSLRICMLLMISGFCSLFCGPIVRAADSSVKKGKEKLEESLIPKQSNELINREYRKMLREERLKQTQTRNAEKIASGIVAVGIGVYGYYFDQQNTGRQLAYSATQTAGILMISNSLLEAETPSLLLRMDNQLRHGESMSYREYKTTLVTIERLKSHAAYKQVAYSSGILSVLYGFNSFQERKSNLTLRNVFAFLSLNFAVISSASFYQLSNFNMSSTDSVSFGILPTPYIALEF